MNNFLAIQGSKETIDRLTEMVVAKGAQAFVINIQSDTDQLSDGYSIVKNHSVGATGSLITFERKKETELHIQISIMGNEIAATIGVAIGLASNIDDIRVEHKFCKKNAPFVGGYYIENRKLNGFFCWKTSSELCGALTRYIVSEVLDPDDPQKCNGGYVKFISRDKRAGICHDYFEDNYEVNFNKNDKYFLRVSREDAVGESLDIDTNPSNSLVIGDVVWSLSENSIIEGLLHEFIKTFPSHFYQNSIPMKFSTDYYQEVKSSNCWES